MTVEAARDLCALKGGIKERKEDFGLAIKDTTTWLQPGDTLDKYNLQKAVSISIILFYSNKNSQTNQNISGWFGIQINTSKNKSTI